MLLIGHFGAIDLPAVTIEKISLPVVADIQRADIYYVKCAAAPKAILVLCPGYNGSGEVLIQETTWQKFVGENNLGLVGVSFASDAEALKGGRGYYYASQGSGELLLQAIRQAYGQDLPLLIYGFSGGAQFTSRFVEWKPDRVIAWCAYSAEWWDKPAKSEKMPPGIVACGDEDERLGASLIYFKQGRAMKKPWLWIDLPKAGHAWSALLDDFVRAYFEIILYGDGKSPGIWVDIDTMKKYPNQKDIVYSSESAWLPSEDLLPLWKKIDVP